MWVCLLGSLGVNILFAVITEGARGDAILLASIVLLIVIHCAWTVVAIRRLNDLQRSRWWAIGLLAPIFNIALMLGLLFRKGVIQRVDTDASALQP